MTWRTLALRRTNSQLANTSPDQVGTWRLLLVSSSSIGERGVMGVGVLLIRSVISTSSPTRRTAPLGPAQAYWPNTGLSTHGRQPAIATVCIAVAHNLRGNFSLTLLSFISSPYSWFGVLIITPLERSAFKLRQRTVLNKHRTDTS